MESVHTEEGFDSLRRAFKELKVKEIKTISIKCETKDVLNIAEMTELQGKLKSRSDIDYDKIKLSIIKYGFSFPFFCAKLDGKNYILDGHGRFATLCMMQKDGYLIPDLPVVYVDCKDVREAKQKLLRLNSQYGKMTKESVLEFADDLEINFDEISLPDTTIDFSDQSEETPETEGDDEVPEVEEDNEPDSELGGMYELGNSILLCADSTNPQEVQRLMGGEKASLVFCDPPYGMKKEKEGIANDNLNFDDLLEFNKKWIPLSFDALKDNGSWYCWGIDEPLMDIYSEILKPMAKEQKITFGNLLTWNKGYGQGQTSKHYRKYAKADEKCLFVMCGVQGFNNNQDNYFEAWEDLRVYFETEIKKFNESDLKIANELGFKNGGTVKHWYSKSQWEFITEKNYRALQKLAENKGIDALKKEYDALKKEFYKTRAYFDNTHDNMNNVWCFARTGREERIDTGGHATPKPIALCERGIITSSRKGEIVLDLFGGSGSTLIASEKNGRKCRMIEINPYYCDVIRRRYTKWCLANNRPLTSGCLE